MLNIDDNRVALTIVPILRLAFRPLFLGGTLFSVIAMSWWTYFWLNPFAWEPHGGAIWWHGHEMLFGFGSAIVVGFLLTAVQTWTGVIGLRGKLLAVLFTSWLLGRLLVAFGSFFPVWMIVGADLSFLLFAAIAMAYPVIKVKQWRNLMFVPMLFALALLNGAGHWGVLNNRPDLALQSLHGAVMLITLIIIVVGGRVIPFFTANSTGCERLLPLQWLEALSVITVIMLTAVALVGYGKVPAAITVPLCVIAALANGWRFLRWGYQYSWRTPLLWSLHLAYAFIPLGLLALAFHSAGYLASVSTALHCFTAGAVGGMILAMISRVTLGHTGRPLNPPRAIVPAYICILTGAGLRVVVPTGWPEYSQWGVGIAGLLWVLAYGIYCVYYGPMLVTERADGRPG
ncbi:MAG: NnrS family protein [Halieaceae bacterium]|nr:NnrS family protein [Halieaceae bacterium]